MQVGYLAKDYINIVIILGVAPTDIMINLTILRT